MSVSMKPGASPNTPVPSKGSSSSSPATAGPQHIPLTMATAAGDRLYVLENEAFHRTSGGKKGGKKSNGSSPLLPEMTASLADFSVVGKDEGEMPRKARLDESEWVVVPSE